ncbi:MAG TPA: biotin/lipoyl-binding protein [Bacteroidetes bacterium]|nr:biotin/lipoyl-binding protein [Bacteroidota bacterium]
MTSYEIELKGRTLQVKVIEQGQDTVKASINGKIYELDIRKVEPGVYSLLHEGKSLEMQISEGKGRNKYTVQLDGRNWDVQIIDADVRFQRNRNKGKPENGMHEISSPMPGKVVKVLVEKGEEVKEGQTLIVISAMKMESEYHAPRDAKVKDVLIKEGDTIEGNQPLITFE